MGLGGVGREQGLGIDYDVGFASFFGAVPEDSTATGRAAAMIGQGKVEASALAMATVVASVQAGETVVPRLLPELGPPGTDAAAPLGDGEARSLRRMLGAVVERGSGSVLAGLPGERVLAKTGTAEFGSQVPPQTHAWFAGYSGDLAFAVLVADGGFGGAVAAPVAATFLRQLRG